MPSAKAAVKTSESDTAIEAVSVLRNRVLNGEDWVVALLETIARWTDAESTISRRRYNYFIGGEAFDWLLLAERLCLEIHELVVPTFCWPGVCPAASMRRGSGSSSAAKSTEATSITSTG